MKQEKRLLIFTGAGFSKSIDDSLLTTKELYDQHITEANGISHLPLISYWLGKDNLDVEAIAQKYRNVAGAFTTLSDQSYTDSTEIIVSAPGYQSNNVPPMNIAKQCRESMTRLNEIVIDKLDRQTLSKIAQDNVKRCETFLKALGTKYTFDIFSTNYDNLIRHIQDDNHNHYLEKETGALNVININKLINEGSPYSYIPLKGMVDWRREEGKLIQSKQHVNNIADSIIMPLEQTWAPDQEPHKTMYNKFESEAALADALLFIGFSFRDRYINDVLTAKTNSSQKIIVLTKFDSDAFDQFKTMTHTRIFKKFAKNSKNLIYKNEGFDKAMQDYILAELS